MNTYENLENFCTENGIDQNTAIGLIKQGMKYAAAREVAKVREKERRDLATEALKFYRSQMGTK